MAGTGERQTLALLQVSHAVSPTLRTHADTSLTQGVRPILGGRSLAHVTLVLRCACSQNGGVLVKLCHILSLVTVHDCNINPRYLHGTHKLFEAGIDGWLSVASGDMIKYTTCFCIANFTWKNFQEYINMSKFAAYMLFGHQI